MQLQPHVFTAAHPGRGFTRYLPTKKVLRQAGLTSLVTPHGSREVRLASLSAARQEHEVGLGVWMSEELLQRMSKAHTGKKPSPEVHAKTAASTYGTYQLAATKQKIGANRSAAAKPKAEACNDRGVLTRRPRHYWTDANLRMELEPHVIALQHNPLATPTRYLPTRKALCQAGLTALATALATRGGVYSVTVMNLMNAKVIPRHQRLYNKSGARKGASPSERTRQRMSEAHRGKTHSPEVRAKIAASRRGTFLSEATKQKIGSTQRTVGKRKAEAAAQQKAVAKAETAAVKAEVAKDTKAAARAEKEAEAARRKAEAAAARTAQRERRRAETHSKRAEAARRKAAAVVQKLEATKLKTEAAEIRVEADRVKAEAASLKAEKKAEAARLKAGIARVKAVAARAKAEALCKGEDQEQRKEVGVAEVQQIVAELMQLKRDLRHWRSYTKDKYGRLLSEEETSEGFPHIHKKMNRHTELQDFMHSLD